MRGKDRAPGLGRSCDFFIILETMGQVEGEKEEGSK